MPRTDDKPVISCEQGTWIKIRINVYMILEKFCTQIVPYVSLSSFSSLKPNLALTDLAQ